MLSGLINTAERTLLDANLIQIDGGTQMRASLDAATVQEYQDAMQPAGWGDFPPVICYYDGTQYWLADGFHRVAAFRAAAATLDQPARIPADVRSGTRRDAILHAAGANASHGLRRTSADKRRAVETLLRDAEWGMWSNREIARRCGVDEKTVRETKKDLKIDTAENPQYNHPKTGQPTTMRTANIGANRQPAMRRYESGLPALNVPLPTAVAPVVASVVVATPVDGEKLLTEWTEADWANYSAAKNAAPVALDVVAVDETPLPAWVTGEPQPVSHRDGYDSDEWYTPGWVIEAARSVMGEIDLDPASCELAQETVQAGLYWTKQQDGCRAGWFGRVWLNPPYSTPAAFVDKLIDSYTAGDVKQACVLLNNSTETRWFQRLLARFPVVFFNQRLAFWRHDHADVGARQGQAVFYLGPEVERFCDIFGDHGIVVRRVD